MIIDDYKRMKYERANAFYESLKFPVKYHVGIKEVLSGLSPNSAGNGTRKNSKIHLILDEDFESGRLRRKAGDFLCSQQSRPGNWSGQNDDQLYFYLTREIKYVPEITCVDCLAKLKKFLTP